MSAPAPRSAGKSTAITMVAIFGSRIFGLVREVVIGSIFGRSDANDALYAAFRIPNLLRDLLAEGALSTAFVTTFSKKLATQGKASAFHLASIVLSSLSVLMFGICLLGVIGSDWIVQCLSPGFAAIPGKMELTVELTRILFPFIGLVSLAALYMGLLNSLGSFGLPASASTVFNITSVASGICIGYFFDPHLGPNAIYGFAIGILIGGLCQLLVQVPKARQLGFRPKWIIDLKDPDLRQMVNLMIPAIIGGAAVQVNVMVNTVFASYMGPGAVTALNYSFRLMQLPIGLFGVAIATVTLTSVSRAAAVSDFGLFRSQLEGALRQAFFLTLPASVGLALLAEPIIRIIYQHGNFHAEDTAVTASLLQAYSLGLAFYAAIKVISPAFYALNKPALPFRVSMIGIILNLVLNFTFVAWTDLGLPSLPFTTSLVALLNFLQLYWMMRGQIGGILQPSSWMALLRIVLACGIMAAVVQSLHAFAGMEQRGFLLNLLVLFLQITAGALAYAAAAWALGIGEMQVLLAVLRRKLLRK